MLSDRWQDRRRRCVRGRFSPTRTAVRQRRLSGLWQHSLRRHGRHGSAQSVSDQSTRWLSAATMMAIAQRIPTHTDSPHVRAALPYEIMKVAYENQPLNSLIGLHVGFLGGKQASRQTRSGDREVPRYRSRNEQVNRPSWSTQYGRN